MTLIVADRVKETTTTTGTGTLTLAGAATGFRAFSAVCANSDTAFYSVSSAGGSEWEVGLGTWATGNTLARTSVIASSNAGSLVNFSAGSKDVYLTMPAAQIANNNRYCDGRLTLTSATPITTSDVTAATTVYFTPYLGNEIALYTGGAWRLYRFAEISVALGTLSNATNYDVFAYDSSGAVTLKIGPAWSSDTSRGTGAGTTELELFEGVYVNKVSIASGPGARAGRYLGTFRTTATTTTEDSGGGTTTQVGGKRFLFNMYNRVQRHLAVIDTTDFWGYTTNTVRQANGASGNKVEFVVGLDTHAEAQVVASLNVKGSSSTSARAGVGVDSTSAFSGLVGCVVCFDAISMNGNIIGVYSGVRAPGYRYFAWCEAGTPATTCNFLGDEVGSGTQSGLSATVVM